jgi:predicted DNA-binding antitoxin AbrB/MazE fold protein
VNAKPLGRHELRPHDENDQAESAIGGDGATDAPLATRAFRPAVWQRPRLTAIGRVRRAILRFMRPVDAFYENGLLRPVSQLPLRSGERVALIVVRRPDASRWDFTRLAAHPDDDLALAEAGLDEWAAALEREDRD